MKPGKVEETRSVEGMWQLICYQVAAAALHCGQPRRCNSPYGGFRTGVILIKTKQPCSTLLILLLYHLFLTKPCSLQKIPLRLRSR